MPPIIIDIISSSKEKFEFSLFQLRYHLLVDGLISLFQKMEKYIKIRGITIAIKAEKLFDKKIFELKTQIPFDDNYHQL